MSESFYLWFIIEQLDDPYVDYKNSLIWILLILKKWISLRGGGLDNVDKGILLNVGTFWCLFGHFNIYLVVFSLWVIPYKSTEKNMKFFFGFLTQKVSSFWNFSSKQVFKQNFGYFWPLLEFFKFFFFIASPDFMTNYFCILTNRHCYDWNESLIFWQYTQTLP